MAVRTTAASRTHSSCVCTSVVSSDVLDQPHPSSVRTGGASSTIPVHPHPVSVRTGEVVLFIQDSPILVVLDRLRLLQEVTWTPSRTCHSSAGCLPPGTRHLAVSGPVTRHMADTRPRSRPLAVPGPVTRPGAVSPSLTCHPAVPGPGTSSASLLPGHFPDLSPVQQPSVGLVPLPSRSQTCHPSGGRCRPMISHLAVPGPICRPGTRHPAIPRPITRLEAFAWLYPDPSPVRRPFAGPGSRCSAIPGPVTC